MQEAEFASRLNQTLARKGMTQASLAEAVGVSQASVSRWLGGTLPHPKKQMAICEALGVQHEWLVFGLERPPQLVFTEPMRRRLIEARKKAGRSLHEIAAPLKWPVDKLESVERGEEQPTPRLLANWIHVLNLNEDWIFTGNGEMVRSDSAFEFIPPWEIEKAKSRAMALREEAVLLTKRADRMDWEIKQSEIEYARTGKDHPRLARSEKKRSR
jgi:transcriptional regulator with XRE-family HTH domain